MNDEELHKLIGEVRTPVGQSIDVLHAAAILESRGLTDDRARATYGVADAFALATVVRSTVNPVAAPLGPDRDADAKKGVQHSPLGHGILYAFMALSVAGLLGVVTGRSLATAVVFAGAIGWIWAAITSWLSYQLAGHGSARRARKLVLVSALGCVIPTVVGSGIAVAVGALQASSAYIICSLVSMQVGATLLFLAGRRKWLLFAAIPGAAAGILALAVNTAGRSDDTGTAAVVATLYVLSVVGILGAGLVACVRSNVEDEQPMTVSLHKLPGLTSVALYAGLCAAFLLVPQSRLLVAGGDTILGMAGLVLVMGLVEWRALSLGIRARRLLATTTFTSAFHRRLRLLIGRELGLVVVVAAAVNTALGFGLSWWGHLTNGGAWLLAVTSVLAGAYFIVLAVANVSAYRPLNLVLLGVCSLQIILLAGFSVSPVATLAVATLALLVAAGGVLLTRPVRSFA